MKKFNHLSYDGNFYCVNKCEMDRALALEYLRRHGTKAPIPIIFIGCNIKSERWKFYEVEKVLNEKQAVPMIRIGLEERRCSYCNERKCIVDGHLGSISFDTDGDKFTYRRHVCKCLNRESNNYLIVEYKIDNEHFADMVARNQCPACRAYGKMKIIEYAPDLESKLTKAMKNLEPKWRDKYLSLREIRFNCKGCDLKIAQTIEITKEFYKKIKGVIENPSC